MLELKEWYLQTKYVLLYDVHAFAIVFAELGTLIQYHREYIQTGINKGIPYKKKQKKKLKEKENKTFPKNTRKIIENKIEIN